MPGIRLSIVIPVFNELENVDLLYQSVTDALAKIPYCYELVLVDDGSSDGSTERLKHLVTRDHRVRLIVLRRNFGQTVAMQAGIQNSRGEIIVTMDADLQNDPCDIPKLVELIGEGHDMVAGWRKNRQDRLLSRKIPSRIANWMIRRLLGLRVHDLGCTLRAYRAALIQSIPLYADLHRFIPAMCSMASDRIIEVEVQHHHRRHGKSKYGLSRTWRVMADAFTLKMLLSCAQRPVYWFGFWALAVFLLAGVFGFATVAMALENEEADNFVLPGITLLLGYLGSHLIFAGIFSDIVIRSEPTERVAPLIDVYELEKEHTG